MSHNTNTDRRSGKQKKRKEERGREGKEIWFRLLFQAKLRGGGVPFICVASSTSQAGWSPIHVLPVMGEPRLEKEGGRGRMRKRREKGEGRSKRLI